MPTYLLVDNGSRQPDATRYLRCLASQLSEHTGRTIHPVSLQHADAIPASELDGSPAQVFGDFLEKRLQQGEKEFVVIPLFFGLSRAVTSFIPQQVDRLKPEYPGLEVRVAPVVYPLPEGDERLAEILFEHIRHARQQGDPDARVVLVDHGSPSPQITDVRKGVARDLARRYGIEPGQAVMERREGKEYDFNGDLLANWLREQAEQGVTSVIVAMLFFLPGRHAGPHGDVTEICNSVVKEYPRLSYLITPLVCEHPLLLDILGDRLLTAESKLQ